MVGAWAAPRPDKTPAAALYGAPAPRDCPLQRVEAATGYGCQEGQECSTHYEEKCSTEYEKKCETSYETVYNKECKTVVDTKYVKDCQTKVRVLTILSSESKEGYIDLF